jgi:histidinol phosphatase-like enzyme (inositol monophosphatase family)
MSESTLLADVIAAARLAGDVAMSHFATQIEVVRKRDGSPVTLADREAEAVARSWIASRYPSDTIVGEEHGVTPGISDRRWFVDPIDGTRTFIRGVPLWGSMIGVAIADRVVAGAVYCPALGLMVAAADGLGCSCNGRPCYVSQIDKLQEATILATDERFLANPHRAPKWHDLASRVATARTWGDCYGYLLVATGQAELMVDDRMSPWDAAPLIPIIRESGGDYSDWSGTMAVDGGDAIATNAALATEFRSRLGVPETYR